MFTCRLQHLVSNVESNIRWFFFFLKWTPNGDYLHVPRLDRLNLGKPDAEVAEKIITKAPVGMIQLKPSANTNITDDEVAS